MMNLQKFNEFLGGIDLAEYRRRYSKIKIVELDMPRHIRPMHHLYRECWENCETPPDFDRFYQTYSRDLAQDLEKFRVETMFSDETFRRGLPARIYRTWASLLTQIQGGYVAAEIYGRDNVSMSADLDYQGIDIQIRLPSETLNIQIKKETKSREVRAPWFEPRKNADIIMVPYEVPGCGPLTPTGKTSIPFARWETNWAGKLKRLENDFILFAEEMFSLEHLGKSQSKKTNAD